MTSCGFAARVPHIHGGCQLAFPTETGIVYSALCLLLPLQQLAHCL